MEIDVQIAESLIEAFNHEETGILLWDKNDKLLYRNIDMEKRFKKGLIRTYDEYINLL